MGYVDILYWKLAIALGVIGIFFFFMTAESLVNGKFRLPAWVFSIFTLVIGVFFFHTFLNSMAEFRYGSHDTIDEMFQAVKIIRNFLS
ncbi:MAG: hypothetical protein ABIC40_03000 [bacterium]